MTKRIISLNARGLGFWVATRNRIICKGWKSGIGQTGGGGLRLRFFDLCSSGSLGTMSKSHLVILRYLVFKYKATELSVGRAITENNALFWGVNKLIVLPLIGTEILAI